MHKFFSARSAAAIILAAAIVTPPLRARAQQSPNWFVPGAPRPATTPTAPARPPARPTATPSRPVAPLQPSGPADQDQQDAPQTQVQLPPVPELPALPKGVSPPAAVIGVLGVPEVMHASTAAQAVEKVIGERREKLNQDAQKEQAAWRDMQQALANQRGGLTPDQIRTRERELQERITNAQRQFRDRNRIIQEAAQVALGQIERTLIAVIRQVAESRGMNLVLHRAQVALNINEFDITAQVGEQINKVLPAVVIPPDGVAPTAANIQPIPLNQTAAVPTPGPAPAPASPTTDATPPATPPAAPPAPAPAPAPVRKK